MSSCQFCQASLNDEVLIAGRCPSCGSLLSWEADADNLADDGDNPADEPEEFSAEDDVADQFAETVAGEEFVDVDESEFEQQADITESGDGAGSITDTTPTETGEDAPSKALPPATEPDLARTMMSRDLSSEEQQLITAVWEGSFASNSSPSMTIEAGSQPTEPTTHLTIQQRRLTDIGESKEAADYELIEQIGRGGVGVVYAARQASIDRTVAVKMLKPELAGDREQREKFLAEAVVTGDLDHPNIVPIHDLGTNDIGALFYSMKRVGGTPWLDVIGKKSLNENLEILLKVSDAIAFAHSRGVVHRDLKPENIMLGDFGEVLVMDWGVALSTSLTLRKGGITESATMGGTPAYMAPEMATGPIESIGPWSDVYLLGAMLFEFITGKTPHTARDVIRCLYAAARNEIQSTDKSGELIEIAYKAMATDPKDRYQDVQAFQTALREYASHSESTALSERADEDLEEARESDDYQDFARSMFAFEEAYALWDGNTIAHDGISKSKLEYASSALRKGDYDLGLSLLDDNDESHKPIVAKLRASQTERDSRQNRLKNIRRIAVGLVIAIFGIGAFAYQSVQNEAERARIAESDALASEADALTSKSIADEERDRAQKALKVAQEQRGLAEKATEEATAEREKAVASEREAVAAQEVALQAKQNEEYEAYIARIGLAAVKIDANAFTDAIRLLKEYDKSDLRNWEWGRLWYLCQQSTNQVIAGEPIESVAISPDGSRFAIAGNDGLLKIWDAQTFEVVRTLDAATNLNSVAYSPDGIWLAAGGDDAVVHVWKVTESSKKPAMSLAGHEDGVTSVSFSPNGQFVLSTSYDKTARLWNLQTQQEFQSLQGHSWWVWSARFSPDAKRIVTTGQDAKVIIWEYQEETGLFTNKTTFSGHRGPVYAAAFAPNGQRVVTADFEGRVLIWNPDEVVPLDIERVIDGDPLPDSRAMRLIGAPTPIRAVAFSGDGKTVLSGGQDNAVSVWDAVSGRLIKSLRGHGGWVRSCQFSPNGEWVLSGSHDGSAKIWNIAGYEEVRVLKGRVMRGHEDDVMSVRFSPNGERVVTASRDRTARVWNLDSDDSFVLEEGHEFLASAALFYDNGRRLITAAIDNTVRVWDVTTGTQLAFLEGTGPNAAVAISNDQQWVATGSRTNGVQLWDVSTFDSPGQVQPAFKLEGHENRVTAIAFSPDNRTLISGDSDGVCRQWRLDSQSNTWVADAELPLTHSRSITAIEFMAGGDRFLTASTDNTVAQWDAAARTEIKPLVLKHPDSVSALAVSPDSKLIATVARNREGTSHLWIWDAASAELQSSHTAQGESIHSAAFSPTGRYLLTAGSEKRLRLWDTQSGMEVAGAENSTSNPPYVDLSDRSVSVWSAIFAPSGDQILTVGGNSARLWDRESAAGLMSFRPHATVASAGFSPNGQYAVTGSWDNSAKIWNLETNTAQWKLAGGHSGSVNCVLYSPTDNHLIVTAGADGIANLWTYDATNDRWTVAKSLTGHTSGIKWAEFSPAGDRIVTASADGTARIWNVQTGQSVFELKGHAAPLLSAAFAPDGRRVITGGEDKIARVWNALTGEEIQLDNPLQGHTASITSVNFSPDGIRILTGSFDNTAKIWDSETGNEILTLRGHSREVTSATFSPDGRSVLTGSRDGTAILWMADDWTEKVAIDLPDGFQAD